MLIRSLAFAPVLRPEMIDHLARLSADASVIDLDAGTQAIDKCIARRCLPESVARARTSGVDGLLLVRVNAPASAHYLDDLRAALACDVDGVVIPNLEDARQVFPAAHWIGRLDDCAPRAARRFVIGGIQSNKGRQQANQICRLAPHLSAIYTDSEDSQVDSGTDALVASFAHAHGVQPIDGPFSGTRCGAGDLAEAIAARALGYGGKICGTSAQVALVHCTWNTPVVARSFQPSLPAIDDTVRVRGFKFEPGASLDDCSAEVTGPWRTPAGLTLSAT